MSRFGVYYLNFEYISHTYLAIYYLRIFRKYFVQQRRVQNSAKHP